MKKTWSFKKHFTISGITLLLLNIILRLILPDGSGISVGFVQGASEPTAMYINSKLPGAFMIDLFSVIIFLVMLVLYKPIKRYIERRFE